MEVLSRPRRVLWGDQGGFTLAEVMITVVIIGIVMAIATSTYQRVIEGRQVDSATNQLVADMRLAHTRSTNQLTEYRIVYRGNGQPVNCDGGTSDYCLLKTIGVSTYEQTRRDLPDGSRILSSTLQDDTAMASTFGGTARSLRFSSSGSAASTGGTAGTTTRITISPEGATEPQHVIDVNTVTSRVQVDP
jgi:type IV fimbrial biogenesis protein FimT